MVEPKSTEPETPGFISNYMTKNKAGSSLTQTEISKLNLNALGDLEDDFSSLKNQY